MGGGTPTSAIGLVVLCSLAEEEEGKYTTDWSSCGPKVELGRSLELVLPGCRSDNHRTSLNAIRFPGLRDSHSHAVFLPLPGITPSAYAAIHTAKQSGASSARKSRNPNGPLRRQ